MYADQHEKEAGGEIKNKTRTLMLLKAFNSCHFKGGTIDLGVSPPALHPTSSLSSTAVNPFILLSLIVLCFSVPGALRCPTDLAFDDYSTVRQMLFCLTLAMSNGEVQQA